MIPQISPQWTALSGAFGSFCAPDSKIDISYILTTASLDDSGSSSSALTKHLLPVREFYDIGDLNFDEILQRDIDDFRVATEIIPYILSKSHHARFFPPILAVIAPHAPGKALSHYPAAIKTEKCQHGGKEATTTYGQCFSITNYFQDEEQTPFATLKFNPDQSRLIVIDGQHRAMAMLAIKRATTGDWGSKGRDYSAFYEEITAQLKDKNSLEKLSKIEMPVCICYFPQLTQSNGITLGEVGKVCRKIFLDVNRQAKKPSQARTLLLDDTNLLSGLTRGILQKIKDISSDKTTTGISIDAFEYDSPSDAPIPKRELAICSVEMLYQLVYWSCFGKDEYYTSIPAKQTGRLPAPQKIRFFTDIDIDSTIPTSTIEEWGYTDFRNEFDIDDVPAQAMQQLSSLYNKKWGQVIIKIFSDLHPFAAHNKAITTLREAHIAETAHGALAYKAFFEGQGLLWTIARCAERKRILRRNCTTIPTSQIELADQSCQKWLEEEFHINRAKNYWALSTTPSPEQVAQTKESFKIFRTQAFTIGLLCALSYLNAKTKPTASNFDCHIAEWINAWNGGLCGRPTTKTNSLRTFDRTDENSVFSKHFGSLKPTDWYWFRYFSFEIMLSSGIDFPGKAHAEAAATANRANYISLLTESIFKAAQRAGEKADKTKTQKAATKIWKKALSHSLAVPETAFNSSLETQSEPVEENGDAFPANGSNS